jgi:hypothetical protein
MALVEYRGNPPNLRMLKKPVKQPKLFQLTLHFTFQRSKIEHMLGHFLTYYEHFILCRAELSAIIVTLLILRKNKVTNITFSQKLCTYH